MGEKQPVGAAGRQDREAAFRDAVSRLSEDADDPSAIAAALTAMRKELRTAPEGPAWVVKVYLQMSPGFSDVLALWDAHHLNNAQKVCVPLLMLLGDMLAYGPEDDAAAQGFVHLQLDGLARAVTQRRMRAVYGHLTSGIRVRHNCALQLCAAVAARSRQLAWEVFRTFDFTLKELPKLAVPPRSGTLNRGSNRGGVPSAWAEEDATPLPTRHVFVRFVLAFLETGDGSLLRPVLAHKALLGNVLRHLGDDPARLASRVLRVLRDRVLAPGAGVPGRLQAALCGDAALEQLAAISAVAAEGDEGGAMDGPTTKVDAAEEEAARAAELAHGVLLRLCTEPAHGLCPAAALKRWRAGEPAEEETETLTGDPETAPTAAAAPNEAGRKGGEGGGVGKRGATVVRLLRKLKPTESRRHAELLLTVCDERPLLAAAYLPHATYSLDPRLSAPWLAAAMLLGKVTSAAAADPTPPRRSSIASSIPGEAEGAAFVRSSLPPSLTKPGLTKGLQHASGLVRHASLSLLLHALRALRLRIARVEEEAVRCLSTEAGAGGDTFEFFSALADQARRAALLVLPDPQALLAVVNASHRPNPAADLSKENAPPAKKRKKAGDAAPPQIGTDGDGGDSEAVSSAAEAGAGLTRIHALNALAGYAALLGADGLAEAKVDPARLLPAAPLALPAAELAATVGVLVEAHGVRAGVQRSGGWMDATSQSAEAMVVSSFFGVVSSAAAAAAAGFVRGGGGGLDGQLGGRSGVGNMPQGAVLGVLLVAARATSRATRLDAACLAAAHLAACGALQNTHVARREAAAWLAHLPGPGTPADATSAVCSFLAEAAGAAARRRGLDADVAAVALHAHDPPAPGWPRPGERLAEEREDGVLGVTVATTIDSSRNRTDDDGTAGLCPVIPAGATGEDLGFSGLAANAVAASVKVLGSEKRSRAQRLAVASYVAAVVFDVMQQQADPVPLAAFVLHAFRKVPLKASLDVTSYPALDSLVAFADVVVTGAVLGSSGRDEATRRSDMEAGTKEAVEALMARVKTWDEKKKKKKKNSDDAEVDASALFEHVLGAPREVLVACVPRMLHLRLADPRVSSVAAFALAGHGPLAPAALLQPAEASTLAALVGATLCSAPVLRDDGGASVPRVAAAMDVAAVRDACRAAAAATPTAELPATARALAFWCAFAMADLERHDDRVGGNRTEEGSGSDGGPTECFSRGREARRLAERGVVSLLGACGSVLARARAASAASSAAEREAARRAILGAPALARGFLRHGPLVAAAVADLVAADLEEGHPGGWVKYRSLTSASHLAAPYVAAAARAVEAEMTFDGRRSTSSAETADDVKRHPSRVVSAATALAVVPLLRHATPETQRRVMAGMAGKTVTHAGGSPSPRCTRAGRALAVEAAAAILSRLGDDAVSSRNAEGTNQYRDAASDDDGDEDVDDEGDEEACAALSEAFSVALALASDASETDGTTRGRASETAAAALRACHVARSRRVARCPDFAALPGGGDALGRAVDGHVDPAESSLAAALVAASPVHAVRLVALAAARLRTEPGGRTPPGLVALLPAIRVVLECHAAGGEDEDAAMRRSTPDRWSDDLKVVSVAFHRLAAGYFLDAPRGVSSSSERPTVITAMLREHAAATLAAADVVTPCEGPAREALLAALAPPGGWWPSLAPGSSASSQVRHRTEDAPDGSSGASVSDAEARATAARALFGRARASTAERHAYVTCLLSTSRVLMLVVPARKNPLGAQRASGSRQTLSGFERRVAADVSAALAVAGEGGLAPAPDALVAAARAFSRATLRRRFSSPAALANLWRLAAALTPRHDAKTSDGKTHGGMPSDPDGAIDPSEALVSLAEDAFERAASHSAASRVLLDPAAAARLPANVAGLATPLASLLPVDDAAGHGDVYDADDQPGTSGDEDLFGASDGGKGRDDDDDAAAAGGDSGARADGSRSDRSASAARIKLELLRVLRALWDLHVAASSSLSDTRDDVPPPAAVWRAEQAGLVPLLAASHGATLCLADRVAASLLTRLDAAAGGGALAGLGYLWGEAAAYFVRTRAALRRAGSTDVSTEADPEDDSIPAEASAVAAALQAGAPPDPRRAAATATRFPHARPTPAPSPTLTLGVELGEEFPAGLVSPGDAGGPAPAWGYDPSWVLPFTLHALRSGAMHARDCVAWGLLSLALAATASAEESTRGVAYAVLRAAAEACETGESFRERGQVVALLTATRNAVTPEAPTPQLPTATAVLAAEAAATSLHPAGDTYVAVQRAVLRRAALDLDALPVGFLEMLNGSGGDDGNPQTRGEARARRVWVLRLLMASLRGGPEDARLFRKAFVTEVLMSHRAAALASDPYARGLALALVVRAARTPAASRPLVEGSGLVAWLAAAVKAAATPTRAHAGETIGSRCAAAAAATGALAHLASQRGAMHGGPSGTAVDFLSALRDIRTALRAAADVRPKRKRSPGTARLLHTEASEEEESASGHPAGALAVGRAMLTPALRFHAAVAKRLARRRGEVIDVSETAALCDAVAAAAADAGGVDDKRRVAARRTAMLDVVVGSEGASRSSGSNRDGGVETETLAAAGALARVVAWAAAAAAEEADAEEASARVLLWACRSVARGGDALAEAMAAREGGGGAVQFASLLGALHVAAGPRHRATSSSALVRAQAGLLRALLPGNKGVKKRRRAMGDAAVSAALRQPAYAALLTEGGALDELLAEVAVIEVEAATEGAGISADDDRGEVDGRGNACPRRVVGLRVNRRGELAAALAGTLLRGALAAVPPVDFVRHVVDECGTGRKREANGGGQLGGASGGRHRFRFEREGWEGMRLGGGGVVDSEGVGRSWRLGSILANTWGVRGGGTPGPASQVEPNAGAGIHAKKKARVAL